MLLLPAFECDLTCIKQWVILIIVPLLTLIKDLHLSLNILLSLRVDEARILGVRALPLQFCQLLLTVIFHDESSVQKHLEAAREEHGSGGRVCVSVAELILLVPLVDEDTDVGALVVQSEQESVQVVSCKWGLQVNYDIDPWINLAAKVALV